MTAAVSSPPVARDLRAWRRVFQHCVFVPLVVTAPVIGLALGSDHRYNVYWHGATVQAHPWKLVTENLRTIPMYVGFGNFRPLGRMLEWTVDVLAYVFAEVTHLPAQVGLRLVTALAAAVLTAAAVLLAEAVTSRDRMFASPPSRAVALLPFGIGACLTAAGPMSTTILFGGLYFLSTALVLGAAAWICRSPRPALPVLAAGAAIAAFNEVVTLAVPLATVALLLRSRLVKGTGLRPALWLWLGFLPVFVPVRLVLWAACRSGDCYRNSDLVIGPGIPVALPNRLTAWLPPLQWAAALRDADGIGLVTLVVAGLVLAVLAVRLFRALPDLGGLDRRQATALAATGGALLLLGALLGSVSSPTQAISALGRWGEGWRDSPLTAAGGMLALAGLLALATSARGGPAGGDPSSAAGGDPAAAGRSLAWRAALAVLVLAGATSAAVGQAFVQRIDRQPPAVLTGQIAEEIARFDTSTAGNNRRCELLEHFAARFDRQAYSRFATGELPQTHSSSQRMRVTADMATGQMYGRPFCRSAR